jgi:6-pyruvoyltetrahydropterin/6-carboxytetrahydropterin synthase
MLITRKAEFSAAHACFRDDLTAGQNQALYGDASNRHGHGHNYLLEVTVEGTPDPVTGMILDLKALKRLLNEEVIEPFDHRFLNHEVPPFDRVVPTAENIAREIWRRLAPRFPQGGPQLHRVRLWETEDLYIDYFGDRA